MTKNNLTMGLSPVVEQIGQLHFEGDIIPHSWFQTPRLRYQTGKPNLSAIVLLADVIYWYRPTLIRDEITGALMDVRQKFRADKLQVSYQAWADRFGLTKRMAQDAFAFLKRQGLVTIEMRTIEIGGVKTPNVIFVEPVYKAIAEITITGGITLKRDISPGRTGHVSHREGTRMMAERETYTKNNTKTSTENSHTGRSASARVSAGSKYSLIECRAFAEHLQKTKQGITNPGGYATAIFRSGEADLLIEEFLELPAPAEAIDASNCPDCEGRGMWYPEGMEKGSVAKCSHKRLTMLFNWIKQFRLLHSDDPEYTVAELLEDLQYRCQRQGFTLNEDRLCILIQQFCSGLFIVP